MNAPPAYTLDILRLAASLEPPRELERVDGEARMRAQPCGSQIATQVRVDRDGKLVGLSQAVTACAFGQASAALVERGSAGIGADEAGLAIDRVAAWLDSKDGEEPWPGMAALAPVRSKAGRHGAVLLPFRALAAALRAAVQ